MFIKHVVIEWSDFCHLTTGFPPVPYGNSVKTLTLTVFKKNIFYVIEKLKTSFDYIASE